MASTPKLAIFDFDGTIANKGVIPSNIITGMKNLHSKGCITTISTGRGYVRLKEVLGGHFDTIISTESLIILEHGTKIVDRNGKIIFGEFFSGDEIDHIVDFIRANIGLFKLVWFNPEDVTKKVLVWCQDERNLDEEIKNRGHYADVFTSSLGELRERLLQHRLTNVSAKLKDYIKVQNLKLSFTRTETNVIFQDGLMEFFRNNINKGLAVRYVAKHLNVDEADILIAGNAINDVEMLDAESGTAILVSKGDERSTILSYLSNPSQIVAVDAPEDLGDYLAQL